MYLNSARDATTRHNCWFSSICQMFIFLHRLKNTTQLNILRELFTTRTPHHTIFWYRAHLIYWLTDMRSTCLLCTIQLSHCGNFSDVLTSMCGVQKNAAPLTHITHTSLFPREHASHVIRSILRIYKFNCCKTINNRHVLRVCCVCVCVYCAKHSHDDNDDAAAIYYNFILFYK